MLLVGSYVRGSSPVSEKDKEEAESLRENVRQLREEMKERQPSLLSAIRHLVHDYSAFARGERDFPRAAVVGVAFAYLRPRVVLIMGSFLAVLLASGQVWLLVTQNRLIDQQNRLIAEQGYALRAQTTGALLSGINDETPPSESQLSVLAAFGDIGYESLIELSSAEGNAGDAALYGDRKSVV